MPANVIFILADQLRRDALGIYGDRNVRTPHIDALGQAGATFTRAYSTYPICVPYRFTLMTGQYAHTRDVPGIDYRLSPAERTLADEFNEAGYESIYAGKWHLYGSSGRAIASAAEIERQRVPRAHQARWQKWMGFEGHSDYLRTVYFEDDDPAPRTLERYQTDAVFDLGIDYLRRRPDPRRPFSLVLSFTPPHCPFIAPQPYMDRWRDRDITLPPNYFVPCAEVDPACTVNAWNLRPEQYEELLQCRRYYYAMIENMDDNVGRLVTFLREAGLADDTTIVVSSDHGDLLGSHTMAEKQYPQEESVGVPLLITGPGIPAGRVIDDPTSTEDLYPTLLGLAGLTPRQAVCGTNLAPLARGETDTLGRDGVMLEYVGEVRLGYPFYWQQWRAFVTERYKYVTFGPPAGAAPWLFYDLRDDLYELNNLVHSTDHQEELARHHELLRQRILDSGDHYALLPAWGCAGVNEPV